MKTLKKLFSVSAIVALLGTLAPMYAFGAGNSLDLDPEFPQAYAYAYANGITTQSEDNADMGGKLTRIALAKMIAKYAINVLKLTPDTSKTCNFTDVTAALDAQYDNGVTQACQLGLMGVNITAFRPNDLVTRGEFGTTFSRALNANSDNLAAMNAADPYYKEHLNYLNKEGIMKVIDPNMLEVRGYVMLMMMRSDESYEPSTAEGCSAEELLACFNADDYDACIAACSDEPAGEEPTDPEAGVTYGHLTVSKGSSSISQAPKNVAGVEMGSFKFKAGDEDTKLTSVTLKAKGYGDYTNLDNVYLVDKNGSRVTRQRNVNSDGEVTLDFLGTYELKANSTATFTIANTIAGGQNGDTFGYELTAVEGPVKVTGLPVETDLVSIATINNLGTVSFGVPTLAASDIKIGEEVVLGGLKLQQGNNKEDARFVSLKVKQEGTASLDSIDNVYLTVNGETVANGEVNGKYVTFTLKDGGYIINKDRTSAVTFNIMGTAVAEPTKTVNFTIDTVEDLVVKGETYGYNLTISNLTTPATVVSSRAISSSEITASFDKNIDTDILATQSAISAGTLKLQSTENNYTLEKLYVTLVATDSNGSELSGQTAFENVVKNVKLGTAGDLKSYSWNGTTKKATAIYEFEGISLNKGVRRLLDLTFDVKNAGADNSFAWTIDLALNTPYQNKLVDNDDNDKIYLGSAITQFSSTTFSNTLQVASARLTLNKVALANAKYVTEAGKTVTAAKGTLEAGSNSDVIVTDINFVKGTSSTIADLTKVISSAKLTVGERQYTATVSSTSLDFNNEFTVEKGSANKKDFELVITLKGDTSAAALGDLQFKVNSVTAEDSEGRNVPVTAGQEFNVITLTSAGTLTLNIVDENAENVESFKELVNADKYVVAGTTGVVVARVKAVAKNEDAKIKNLEFALAGTADEDELAAIRLVNGEDSYTASLTNNKATFTDIDTIVPANGEQYLYLVADLNTIGENQPATAGATIKASLSDGKVYGVDSKTTEYTMTWAPTTYSKVTTIVSNVPATIELVGAANGGITAAGNYKLATLTVTPATSTNTTNDGSLAKLTLSGLNVSFGLGNGLSGATYVIKKVGGTNEATLTNGALSATALGNEGKINGTTSFEIWAKNVTLTGTLPDNGANINVSLTSTDVQFNDGNNALTKLNLLPNVSATLNVSSK